MNQEKEKCDTPGCDMPSYTKKDVRGYSVNICVGCEEKGRKLVEQKIREGVLKPKEDAKQKSDEVLKE